MIGGVTIIYIVIFILGYLFACCIGSLIDIFTTVTDCLRAKLNVKIAEYNLKIEELSIEDKKSIGFCYEPMEEQVLDDYDEN